MNSEVNFSLNTASGLVVAFMLFIVGFVIVRLTHHKETLADQTRLFVVAFLTRIMMILLIYNAGLISIVTDSDSSGWVSALAIRERWISEGHNFMTFPIAIIHDLHETRQESSHVLHKLAYAAVFLVTGMPGRITAASLNALFGALIPVLSYRMSLQVFSDLKAARYLGWILALMPSLLVFSALTAKEPFVVFFEVLGLYCCVQIAQRRFAIRYILAFLLCIYCMQYLRFYVFYVLIGTMITAILVPPFIRGRFKKTAMVMGVLASPLVLYVGYNSAMTERDEATRNSKTSYLSSTSGLKSYSSSMGGNSFVENPFDITQPSQFVPGLLFGFAHLMYAPFPWNLLRGSRLMLLTTPEVVWWYYVGSVRLIRGLRYGLKENLVDSLIPILFCLPLMYYYSLAFSNIGLAYRYRAQIYPELILFIGFGYKRMRARHGYQSYNLQEPEMPHEPVAIEQPEPWISHDRFDGRQRYRSPYKQDRNSRFGRM